MLNCIAVGIGGFFGSIMRYLIGLIPMNNKTVFPMNTLLINIVGAFAIGAVIALFQRHGNGNEKLLLMLKVGLCGGFTTFSTFSYEALSLLESGKWITGVIYMFLSVLLCVGAVYLGKLAV